MDARGLLPTGDVTRLVRGMMVEAFAAGAAAEREAVLAVVRGHRCETPVNMIGSVLPRGMHEGQTCAEAIARELEEMKP